MPNLSDLKQETYLGDSLHASFDERGIKLRADSGDYIFLSMGETLPAFLQYVGVLKVMLSNHLRNDPYLKDDPHLKDDPQPNTELGYSGRFRWETINGIQTLVMGPFDYEEK